MAGLGEGSGKSGGRVGGECFLVGSCPTPMAGFSAAYRHTARPRVTARWSVVEPRGQCGSPDRSGRTVITRISPRSTAFGQ
jgi:hypothetical protein